MKTPWPPEDVRRGLIQVHERRGGARTGGDSGRPVRTMMDRGEASFFAPMLTVISAEARCRCTGVLLLAVEHEFDRRPRLREPAGHDRELTCRWADGASLLPKPPPMCSRMTRTLVRGMPSASATPSFTVKTPWVESVDGELIAFHVEAITPWVPDEEWV